MRDKKLKSAMHRLGLPDVERLLARRRAARLLGKPQSNLDRALLDAAARFSDDPVRLRRQVDLALRSDAEGTLVFAGPDGWD